MKLFSLSSEPVIEAFGWMLLHAVWQGFAIALVAAGILFLLRRKASYSRYWTGIGALTLQVAASVATFALYYQPRVLQASLPKVTQFTQPLMTKGSQVMISLPWYKQTLWFLQSHLETIVLFWVIGASVLLLRLVGSWVYVQQLKAEGIRLTESSIQEMFRRIATALNIRSTVHLFESVRVSTPVVIGFIRPVVLLPVGLATGLSTKQIEAILAHELAHVKRYDYLVNLLQSLVEVVYFFHPALWWVSSRVRIEREHSCDDVAIQICGDKVAFARALAEVEAFRQSPALAMAFASKKGVMLQRVRRVLGVPEKPQRRMSPNALVLLVLLVFGVSVYAFQPTDKPKTPKAKNISQTSKDVKIELDETGKLTKVTWKQRQLSTKEVVELQKLKEKLDNGEITLESIKNSEQKAILARLTDAENGLHQGMAALADGLSHIDFENISIADDQLDAISEQALADAQPIVDAIAVAFSDTIDERKMQYHHRRMDSLNRLMEPQHQKMEALRLEMEQHEFKTSELERKMEVLEWKKNKVAEERSQVLEKRNKTMYQEGQKVKKSAAEVEKEIDEFENQIKQRETQMQQLNQQLGELRQQLKTVRKPVEELENQMRELEELNEKYSREMDFHSVEMIRAYPPPPPPVEPARARAPRKVSPPPPPAESTPRVRTQTPKAVRPPASVGQPVAPAAPTPPRKK
ncbi:hypothetical protein DR864_13670 [Runella rosea]|uniref:Peptidase M56 domain-containing protein n=1 Tax=Runella rosea TaxID=2259595 RepID=A0A344TJA4_9BACT|nr:M56 family metallopeptidase [Runella rosea]AXE18725.1 hypothetical protein DR864_13670 [Runella rosea]